MEVGKDEGAGASSAKEGGLPAGPPITAPPEAAPRVNLSPAPPFPVLLAAGFYAAMALVAVVWRWLYDGALPLAVPDGGLMPLPARVAAGLAAGALGLAASRAWTAWSPAGAHLSAEMGRMIGPIGAGSAWFLAFASGWGEELLFRGAVQPHLGWIAASLLFGAVHYLPGPGLWVWTLYAAVAGLGLGALFAWTGDVVAPATAHMVLNGVQLARMGRENAQTGR